MIKQPVTAPPCCSTLAVTFAALALASFAAATEIKSDYHQGDFLRWNIYSGDIGTVPALGSASTGHISLQPPITNMLGEVLWPETTNYFPLVRFDGNGTAADYGASVYAAFEAMMERTYLPCAGASEEWDRNAYGPTDTRDFWFDVHADQYDRAVTNRAASNLPGGTGGDGGEHYFCYRSFANTNRWSDATGSALHVPTNRVLATRRLVDRENYVRLAEALCRMHDRHFLPRDDHRLRPAALGWTDGGKWASRAPFMLIERPWEECGEMTNLFTTSTHFIPNSFYGVYKSGDSFGRELTPHYCTEMTADETLYTQPYLCALAYTNETPPAISQVLFDIFRPEEVFRAGSESEFKKLHPYEEPNWRKFDRGAHRLSIDFNYLTRFKRERNPRVPDDCRFGEACPPLDLLHLEDVPRRLTSDYVARVNQALSIPDTTVYVEGPYTGRVEYAKTVSRSMEVSYKGRILVDMWGLVIVVKDLDIDGDPRVEKTMADTSPGDIPPASAWLYRRPTNDDLSWGGGFEAEGEVVLTPELAEAAIQEIVRDEGWNVPDESAFGLYVEPEGAGLSLTLTVDGGPDYPWFHAETSRYYENYDVCGGLAVEVDGTAGITLDQDTVITLGLPYETVTNHPGTLPVVQGRCRVSNKFGLALAESPIEYDEDRGQEVHRWVDCLPGRLTHRAPATGSPGVTLFPQYCVCDTGWGAGEGSEPQRYQSLHSGIAQMQGILRDYLEGLHEETSGCEPLDEAKIFECAFGSDDLVLGAMDCGSPTTGSSPEGTWWPLGSGGYYGHVTNGAFVIEGPRDSKTDEIEVLSVARFGYTVPVEVDVSAIVDALSTVPCDPSFQADVIMRSATEALWDWKYLKRED